jgi:glycosyltransferase involved in cell wall biosynthesis
VHPEITVITVCKNAAEGIERTVTSVLAQCATHIEFVIIDGGSTDGTLDVLSHYAPQLDCLVTEPDAGIFDAMNKGLRRAHGELVLFLNAKDTLIDSQVAKRATTAYKETRAAFIYGDVMVIESIEGRTVNISYKDWDLARFFDAPICHQGVFASRQAFDECGGFDIVRRYTADFDWILRALRQKRLPSHYLPTVVAAFDGTGVSSDRNPSVVRQIKAEMKKSLECYFSPWERFGYRLARRAQLRRSPPIWKMVKRAMQWQMG